MPATLTEAQLKSSLTTEQLTAARTQGMAPGDPDPVAEEIAAALAKVETFAAGYDVLAGMLSAWARDLATHQVAKRLGSATEDQIRSFDRANKELEDLRDGKFPNITRLATPAGKVLSGGRAQVI